MVLQNTVILQNDTPTRLHITDHRIETRTITDTALGQPRVRQTLVLEVDRLDGSPVRAVLTTMAAGLADKFGPYLTEKAYRNYDVVITQRGDGFQRKWTVQFIPLA